MPSSPKTKNTFPLPLERPDNYLKAFLFYFLFTLENGIYTLERKVAAASALDGVCSRRASRRQCALPLRRRTLNSNVKNKERRTLLQKAAGWHALPKCRSGCTRAASGVDAISETHEPVLKRELRWSLWPHDVLMESSELWVKILLETFRERRQPLASLSQN